ncbi:UDP-3-O-[3-hydroxymyristoyl] glucosamine N-acyltransferase [Rhizomicrobium palustre]|uniref:UDP-3-O-acylglucosamine N-acyltransferase n=1 Tax=Rhizomicrobium palustre TaxID=189966 RepID=A0A846N0W0_9PROT|nr:UDP-3-O-(3-hydroxymyristoyl)glucosamine N-acyltransferase [Rhizomicrobium palustre]NIK89594.1 UDP-3-O-[3-hydroxymyristoyl] glucosamine N-acyltransferase [Rhizomicrobium palustre]
MADPRFYDNRGPFTLAEVCARVGATVPDGADGSAHIADVASLSGAVAAHLTFFTGDKPNAAFSQTSAGFCLVSAKAKDMVAPEGTVLIPVSSVQHAFSAAAELFYPDCHKFAGPFNAGVHPTAIVGANVLLGAGVVVGPGAEIGEGTQIGPNTVIGRGVAIGRDCVIAGNTVIACAFIGDQVSILAGAQIGQPGFGFASSASGHIKIPQLGRVIIQDRVEIGACTTIDRGALGDTVVGEGTKIDNLVQIGHNTHIGRHSIIVSQVGISGSTEIGDFVVLAGQVGVSDHVKIGSGARLGGKCGVFMGQVLEGGKDYGGIPAKPVRDWLREISAVGALVKKPKRGS